MGKGKRQRKAGAKPDKAEEAPAPPPRAPAEPEPPLDLPPPRTRRRINALIAVTLGFAVFIPLTYYMSDDRRDERYAWRMFSAQRAEVCEATVVEDRLDPDGQTRSHPLDLVVTIHQAWVSGLKLGRPDIVDRFLDYRCEQPDVRRVVLTRDCRSGAGRPLPPDVIDHPCPDAAPAAPAPAAGS
ncbi:MAG: hypothetical protein H6746_06630 [Deltaproteobacteria bacterium]|nr:hypothetical protein [Deltaproteobacteria bacterium]